MGTLWVGCQGSNVFSDGKLRLWSDCVDAQANLSLHCTPKPSCTCLTRDYRRTCTNLCFNDNCSCFPWLETSHSVKTTPQNRRGCTGRGKFLHWSQQDRRSVAAASLLSMHKILRSPTSCKGFLEVADKSQTSHRTIADRSQISLQSVADHSPIGC